MTDLLTALKLLSMQWEEIKSQGGTLDVDSLMEEIALIVREHDYGQSAHSCSSSPSSTRGGPA